MSSLTSTISSKLPPSGKYYPCFQSDGKSDHADQCDKSQALNKVIGLILEIESFEQLRVIMKGILQSDQLKKHIVTIVIDQ